MNQERRRFYRINDKVSLNYRVIQPGDLQKELDRTSRKQKELAELRNAALAIDARLDVINSQLQNDNPVLAEILALFQRKMALHEAMLGVDDYDESAFSQAREINLSASGLAFDAETPLKEGTSLKLELVTYPEHHYISVFASVVNCQALKNDRASGYRVAVDFRSISDEDEEKIVHHIFKKQAEEIKKVRVQAELETGASGAVASTGLG